MSCATSVNLRAGAVRCPLHGFVVSCSDRARKSSCLLDQSVYQECEYLEVLSLHAEASFASAGH